MLRTYWARCRPDIHSPILLCPPYMCPCTCQCVGYVCSPDAASRAWCCNVRALRPLPRLFVAMLMPLRPAGMCLLIGGVANSIIPTTSFPRCRVSGAQCILKFVKLHVFSFNYCIIAQISDLLYFLSVILLTFKAQLFRAGNIASCFITTGIAAVFQTLIVFPSEIHFHFITQLLLFFKLTIFSFQ